MNSRLNILLETLSCKDKTCPVCNKGRLILAGTPGNSSYECSNPECIIKNCSELWFLHLVLRKGLDDVLRFSWEHSDCTEFGRTPLGMQKLADRIARMTRFKRAVEAGLLEELGKAGIPCTGLGEHVLGMLGFADDSPFMKYKLRFMYSDGIRIVAEQSKAGLKRICDAPGCFPLKTGTPEPVVYAFKDPLDVLRARQAWNAAGLGDFPAYVFTSFPMPAAFFDTCKIVLVNPDKDMLESAKAAYPSGVSAVAQVVPNLNVLRELTLLEKETDLPENRQAKPGKIVGETKNGFPIYFSETGYLVGERDYGNPHRVTNFAFLPKRVYASNYPSQRRLAVADLYANGLLIEKGLILGGESCLTLERAARNVLLPGTMKMLETASLRSSSFPLLADETVSFPFVPCVSKDAGIVFPKFRITKNGFDPHPELFPLFLEIRENLDYVAMEPEPAFQEDFAELAKLFARSDSQSEAVILGLCAWLYMVISGLVTVTSGVYMPKLCFEIHTFDGAVPKAMSFLSLLFSGNLSLRNNAARFKNRRRTKEIFGLSATRLPGLFDTRLHDGDKSCNYASTKAPGLYSVRNSDLSRTVNAAGNTQRYILATGELPHIDPAPIRRALLHILLKYVKTAERIDPVKWMVETPEIFMYNSMANAMRKIGIWVSGPERFAKLYVQKGKTHGY